MEFLELSPWLQWLVEHIYIILIFWYKNIKSFFQASAKRAKQIDILLATLVTTVEQHEIRISTIEGQTLERRKG